MFFGAFLNMIDFYDYFETIIKVYFYLNALL